MSGKAFKILISAGGTGGHIFPALAIAEEIRRRNASGEILFVGTKRGLEKRVIPPAGFRLKTIVMSGLARSFRPGDLWKNALMPFKLMAGFMQSLWILCRFRPVAVIGCGGYVTGPVVWLAAMMNRLTFVQDQNSRPGRTTVFLSRWADRIYLAYADAAKFIHHPDRSVVCGNPLRSVIRHVPREEACRKFGLRPDRKTLLIVGGSLGAHTLNKTIRQNLDVLLGIPGLQAIWQTGSPEYDTLRLSAQTCEQLVVTAFIESMPEAYSSADLILCRAGAMTLAELACYGLPSILVPYPYAADNHQEFNARTFVQAGAAVMIRNEDLENEFMKTFGPLFSDPQRLQAMSAACLSLARPDAAKKIADDIELCIRQKELC